MNMKKQETEFFWQLCRFRSPLDGEIRTEDASPAVLGHLFMNRMQGIAYGRLRNHDLLGRVNREFRNALRDGYDQNLRKNRSYAQCLTYLGDLLSGYEERYAMLKGAVLCKQYPAGYRTSNDVDLLIRPTDVTLIGNLLRDEGFRQGDIRNGVFTPAARQEIIASRMMRGETVPFIKEVGLPGMPYLEVDLNFSLDYANGDITVLDMMLQAGRDLRTLTSVDFFIHLCGHLYKEAATLPWVRMGRDMTLYKYADIYLLLSSMNEADITRLFARSARMGLDKICAYAIMQTAALFDMKVPHATSAARRVLRDDRDFLHTVISPSDRKTYLYTEKDIVKRFFHPDRKSLLREVET